MQAPSNVNYSCLSIENDQNGRLYTSLEGKVYSLWAECETAVYRGDSVPSAAAIASFPHTSDLSEREKTPKPTSELIRSFVHNGFKVFQLALLRDMIYRFTSCCLALVHHEEQGVQTNWIPFVWNIFRQQFPGDLLSLVQSPLSLNIVQALLRCTQYNFPTERIVFFCQFGQLRSTFYGEYHI